jgi:hypothetical protein
MHRRGANAAYPVLPDLPLNWMLAPAIKVIKCSA